MEIFAGSSLETKAEANKFTSIPLKTTVTIDWDGPTKCPSVQELIDALSKIENKKLPVTVIDGHNGKDPFGILKSLVLVEINEDDIMDGNSMYTSPQVLLGIVSRN